MSSDDEQRRKRDLSKELTRPVRAVQRRADVSKVDPGPQGAPAVKRRTALEQVDTRPKGVRAVTRRGRLELESVFERAHRVKLFRRGGLLNAAGGEDNGWVARDDAGEELLRFVLCDEPLLKTVARTLGYDADYPFDVMRGPDCLGRLVISRVEVSQILGVAATGTGSATLLDTGGHELLRFAIEGRGKVSCFTAGQQSEAITLANVRREVHARAGRRHVATLLSIHDHGVLGKLSQVEVSFEPSATHHERLLTVAAATVGDAWQLEVDDRARGP